MTFGEVLRGLRKKEGVGIKKLAPALGVNYSYLSKLENHRAMPSEELIDKVARYFDYNRDDLMILADKIPPDVKGILRDNPREAVEYLRRRFASADREPIPREPHQNHRESENHQ